MPGERLLDTLQTSCHVEGRGSLHDQRLRKEANEQLAAVFRAFDSKRADRLERCAYKVYARGCVTCGTLEYRRSFLCGDRFCPICARKRSTMLLERYKPIVEAETSGFFGHMLTLTYKNDPVLRDRKLISKHIRNLLRRKLWNRYGGIAGGLYSVEVTLGEGGWHPHVHMLIFTRRPVASYIDQKWLIELNQEVSDAWLYITGDSYIVRGVCWDGDLREIVKYVTKSPEVLPTDKLRELAAWSRAMRSVSAFGCFYGKTVSEDIEQEEDAATTCKGCGGHSFRYIEYTYSSRLSVYVRGEVKDMTHSEVLNRRE